MAITNVDLIADALREIGVITEIEAPTAEQGAHGLRKLNQMMAEWEEGGIRLDYFEQTSTSDACPIPAHTESAVTIMLSMRLAPSYGATASPELVANAEAGWQRILRIIAQRNMPEADLSNRPRGEGSPFGRSRILTG